jgi:hypothetical protein
LRRRSGGGGAPARAREEEKGGVREMQGVTLPLYRVEEEGEEVRKAVGGGARRGRRWSSPGHHRRRRLEATGHYLRRDLDREQEEKITELTRGSMTAMGR